MVLKNGEMVLKNGETVLKNGEMAKKMGTDCPGLEIERRHRSKQKNNHKGKLKDEQKKCANIQDNSLNQIERSGRAV